MRESIISIFKGLWIGGTMTVPGVSGGSMAMILNIYDKVIYSVASFRKNPKKNLIFLLEFAIAGLVGVLIFSKYIITPLMENYPLQTGYFFLGAVAGGAPVILKASGTTKVEFKTFVYPIVGMIPVLLIAIIPPGAFDVGNNMTFVNYIILFFGGLFVSIPLVLPGISVSQVLLMMGIYKTIMEALGRADFKTIFMFTPLIIGTAIGTLCVAKIMQTAIEKYHQKTYLVIFGFVLGSVPQLLVFCGLPTLKQAPVCILTAVLGFLFIYLLQKLDVSKEKAKEKIQKQN